MKKNKKQKPIDPLNLTKAQRRQYIQEVWDDPIGTINRLNNLAMLDFLKTRKKTKG